MSDSVGDTIRQQRERVLQEHMDAENRLDFDAALATFTHPRYELIGLGTVHDGAEAVAAYFRNSRRAFPDQSNEIIAMHHADHAVICEFWLKGTHLGAIGDLAPTGRTFRERMVAVFEFEGAGLVCERIYFNPNAILAQLTAPDA